MTGTEITALRELLEIDASALAKLLDVTTRTVSRWERGEASPEGTAHGAMTALKRATATKESAVRIRALVKDTLEVGGFTLFFEQLLAKEGTS